MSTRVRIYELSKELELENKEILNICETLGIVAKSHSSTITEDEATAIRDEAPKIKKSLGVVPGASKKAKLNLLLKRRVMSRSPRIFWRFTSNLTRRQSQRRLSL